MGARLCCAEVEIPQALRQIQRLWMVWNCFPKSRCPGAVCRGITAWNAQPWLVLLSWMGRRRHVLPQLAIAVAVPSQPPSADTPSLTSHLPPPAQSSSSYLVDKYRSGRRTLTPRAAQGRIAAAPGQSGCGTGPCRCSGSKWTAAKAAKKKGLRKSAQRLGLSACRRGNAAELAG